MSENQLFGPKITGCWKISKEFVQKFVPTWKCSKIPQKNQKKKVSESELVKGSSRTMWLLGGSSQLVTG